MYRLLVTILLCLEASSPAPQAKESDVTYVKIQPVVEDTPAISTGSRESRIEKLPLTFPTNLPATEENKSTPETKLKETNDEEKTSKLSDDNSSSLTKSDLPEKQSNLSEKPLDLSESLDLSETNQSDTISNPNGTEETSTADDLSEVSPTDDLSESQPDTDTVPSETNQFDRRARNFESIETTETAEDTTELYDLTDHTVVEPPRTRAPPKFIPKVAKSRYIPKPTGFHSYSANHLEIVGKRKFRSRCSCQKIWNCPKLQISVPRCPDEYFLCCF